MSKLSKCKWLAIVTAVAMMFSLLPAAGLAAVNGGNGCEGCEPYFETTLYAGQTKDVGKVIVTNTADKLCIRYELSEEALEEGWLIYETHWAVGKSLSDIPQTRANRFGTNPIPGQFPYGDDELEGVPFYEECVDWPEGAELCDELFISSHAVVKRVVESGEAIDANIYGIGTTTAVGSNKDNDGNIYVIDPFAGEEEIIFNDVWSAAGVAKDFWWYPNALAFDEESGRLYFSLNRNSLYFFDVETETVVDADPDNKFSNNNDVLGATFAGGSYWYVLNQSDKLIEVIVDSDGFVTGVMPPITMGSQIPLSQGDIVFKDGVIYGSSGTGAGGGNNFKGFFSYDIAAETFTVLETDPDYRALQLAWGLDDEGNKVLFGHQVETGEWFVISLDPYGLIKVMDEDIPFTTDRFEDIASGFIFEEVWEDETAWGFGERFNTRGNWGWYFNYQLCDTPDIVRFPAQGTAYIGYEDRLTGSDFDYNDFGMTMELEELYVNGRLESVFMKFTAVVNDADDVHDIHIARAYEGDYSYTITRSVPAAGTETPAGSGTQADFTGDFDIILFDTNNFPGITGPGLTAEVTIEITMAEGNNLNLLTDYGTAPRFDLDPVFSLYDPYMFNRNPTLGGMILLTSTENLDGVDVPLIIVVPKTDWLPPAEGVNITTIYEDFLEYYDTEDEALAEWYLNP